MKKSNILLIITGVTIIGCLAAINLKLFAEYKNGNIQSVVKKTSVSTFHHIKELNSLKYAEYPYKPMVNIIQHQDSNYIAYNFYDTIGFDYFIKNDTLYLKADSTMKANLPVINIHCKNLKSLSSVDSNFELYQFKSDSLQLVANAYSSINCVELKCNYVNLRIQNNATISISAKDYINKADIHLLNKGLLVLSDVRFNAQNFSMDSSAALKLTGKSLKGLKLNQL